MECHYRKWKSLSCLCGPSKRCRFPGHNCTGHRWLHGIVEVNRMEFCQYGEFEQYSVSHQVTVYRDWLPKFETGLDFIIKSALYSIFWQDWITNDLNNSFQYFRPFFFLLNHSNQLLFRFPIQVFDCNFQWFQTF